MHLLPQVYMHLTNYSVNKKSVAYCLQAMLCMPFPGAVLFRSEQRNFTCRVRTEAQW